MYKHSCVHNDYGGSSQPNQSYSQKVMVTKDRFTKVIHKKDL